MKTFKTIDEQIDILLSRNLRIDDIEATKKYLLTQNYYKIINGYGYFFPKQNNVFTNQTSFDEIKHLYIFERDLKEAFFKAILAMETHLKSIFSYRFAEANPNIPYAYLNINCYPPDKTFDTIKKISSITNVIEKHVKRKNNSISHYVNQYQDVPIWVLIDYLTFGDLKTLLKNSPISLQNSVAKDLSTFIELHIPNASVFPPEIMMSFIENINDIRNICAHNNRLLDFQCRRDSKYWKPLHDAYNIKANDPTIRKTSYSVYLSLQCFLTELEFSTLHNTILKRSKHLNNKLESIGIESIFETLGFPSNWLSTAKKITPPQ